MQRNPHRNTTRTQTKDLFAVAKATHVTRTSLSFHYG